LFQCELDFDVINNIRQVLTQNQPLGNSRFYTKIETMMGREPPKKQKDDKPEKNLNQGELPL